MTTNTAVRYRYSKGQLLQTDGNVQSEGIVLPVGTRVIVLEPKTTKGGLEEYVVQVEGTKEIIDSVCGVFLRPLKLTVFDTTLRDGIQPPEVQPLNPKQKLLIASHLADLRVDVIEAGFPADKNQRESLGLIAREIHGPTICALARCVDEDIDIAWELIKPNQNPRIHVFAASSDIHIVHKYEATREEVLKMVERGVRRAVQHCEVQFSPEDATRSDLEFLCKVINLAIECGATIINIPDTVGYARPMAFMELIVGLRRRIPRLGQDIVLSVHCHNDAGHAVSNSILALEAGANQVECTVNGIGERAGNAALEAVVMDVRTHCREMDIFTDVNTVHIAKTSALVSKLTGFSVQQNWPIVGANAFRHSSGIHGAGVLKDRKTYEIMDPKDIGLDGSELVLTSTSGKHMVEDKLRQIGYNLSEIEFEKVLSRVKTLASQKSTVTREDLEAIVFDEVMIDNAQTYRLMSLEYNSKPCARVRLKRNGAEMFAESYEGDGAIDTSIHAVNTAIHVREVEIVDYSVKIIGTGSDAQASAMMTINIGDHQSDGKVSPFSGMGLDTDVVRASVKAYLHAVNQALVNQ